MMDIILQGWLFLVLLVAEIVGGIIVYTMAEYKIGWFK